MGIRKLLYAGIAGLSLALAACNGGGDGATAVNEADLIANWLLRSDVSTGYMRMTGPNGAEIMKLDLGDTNTYTGSTYYLDLKADHTYTANLPEYGGDMEEMAKPAARQPEAGTWSTSGANLTLIGSETGSTVKDTLVMQAAVSGNEATFSIAIDEKHTSAEGGMEIKVNATARAVKQ